MLKIRHYIFNRQILTKRKIFYLVFSVVCLASVAVFTYGRFIDKVSAPTIKTVAQNAASNNAVKKQYGVSLGDTLPFLSTEQLNTELLGIQKLGVTWIRIDISWADIQPKSSAQYDWNNLDRVILTAKAHNLRVLGTIAYTPPWAGAKLCNASDKCEPESNAQFANFAATVAKRYSVMGVQDWEIWNEPNLATFWLPAPSPHQYTELLKATYPAIKQVEPNATIISGGLGDLDNNPTSVNQQTFLANMYSDGAKPFFDALGFHPYSFPALPTYVANWSGWSMMNDIPNSIRSIMTDNGDASKRIWITEYGAPTNGPGAIATPDNFNLNNSPDHVSEALQSEMLTQSVNIYKNTPWIGGYFWYTYEDFSNNTSSNENYFGLLRSDGSLKPAYYAYKNEIEKN